MESKTILSKVTEWRKQGAELRSELAKERRGVIARLAEIDKALAEIPETVQEEREIVGGSGILPKAIAGEGQNTIDTLPTLVLNLLSIHRKGLDATAIVSGVQRVRRVNPAMIHSVLYRLRKKTKQIQTT